MDTIKIQIDTNAAQASKSFEDLSKSFKDTTKQSEDLRKQIKGLKDELFTLTPGTKEYGQVLSELGVKMDQLQETTQQLRAATGGLDTVFQTTTSAIGSLAAGFTAAQGVVTLFGGEAGELQKTFIKLQSVMAIMNGLKGFSTFTKESKKAWISLKTFTSQSLLATKAIIQETTATSTLSATQKVATISTNLLKNAFNSLTAAIASNPFGAVLVALTALVTVMSKVNSEAKKAAESQREYNKAIEDLNKVKEQSYVGILDYYQKEQTEFENAHERYEYENNELNIRMQRLKALGISEENLSQIRKDAAQQMVQGLEQELSLLDAEIERLEDIDRTVDAINAGTGKASFHNFGDGKHSLDELRESANLLRKDIQELYAVINEESLKALPRSFNAFNNELKKLGDTYRIDIAAGLKTQGDYLHAQIDAYNKAIQDLKNQPLVEGTFKEQEERAAMEVVYRNKIKELEVDLQVYNAGLSKKATEEAKRAAEALNKNFKKISTDISDKADEYQEVWNKALKDFANIGNYATKDALEGNQSLGRAITEMNRYNIQLDEYCKEWLKSAKKALDAGEITQAQYNKLDKHIKDTQTSMIESMRGELNVFMTEGFYKAGKNIQDISEGFKKQNETMLAALAGGLVTKEEYHSFLVNRLTEYKKEIENEMPIAMQELETSLKEAVANGKDEETYRKIYDEYLKAAKDIVPPSVMQQISTSLKEMIDKEFDMLSKEYSTKMNEFKSQIQEATYGWMYGTYGDNSTLKSGNGLMWKLLFGQGEDPKTTYDKVREEAQKMYDIIKEEGDAEIALLQEKMSLLDQNSDQYQEYADKIEGIMSNLNMAQQELEEKQLQNAQDYADRIYEIASSTTDALGGLASAMGSYYGEQKERAKEMYGENSEEYQKYLKKEGTMKIAEVWANWATGVMAAWAANAKYGVASYILAAIQTAALTATAIASTQQINRQTKAGSSGGGSTANVAGLTDRVIMAEAQNTDQTAQLNAEYTAGNQKVYVTQSDISDAQSTNRVAVTQNSF